MTDFIDTHRPLAPLSPADKIYIQNNFHTLEELCLSRPNQPAGYRSQIRAGLLPLPTYAVDGREMYPADFFVFPDSVGSLGDQLKKEFFARYQRIAEPYGQQISEAQIGEEFASYLSGEYGVCLRWVTPETIFLKGLAMGRIDELLSEPNPGDTEWSGALRSWVNRLDAMEREFAGCDTARFGNLPSRVRYIDHVRAKYPDCFTMAAIMRE
ncbi:MAG TPA: DUF6058 family natural product biosynthesis protein [Chthoniobacterales bacterium]|nr:DUF6058 family natural product biosynthesis protein [Chthoniobacterales bacterium]